VDGITIHHIAMGKSWDSYSNWERLGMMPTTRVVPPWTNENGDCSLIVQYAGSGSHILALLVTCIFSPENYLQPQVIARE